MRKIVIISLIILFLTTNTAFAFNPSYQFTDQEKDFESGLYHFDAREYNPVIGKFLQPDPVLNNLTDPQKLKETTGLDLDEFLMDPQKLNAYGYARDNPIKYVDPTGELQVHFNRDMTEEQKKQFNESLKNLQDTVRNNQEVIDYFNQFGVDIMETLEDNNKGPDVFLFRENKTAYDSKGNYDKLWNDIDIFTEAFSSLESIQHTLMHELGHWANDVGKLWGNLNPDISHFETASRILDKYRKDNLFLDMYIRVVDGIYGFFGEIITFGYVNGLD